MSQLNIRLTWETIHKAINNSSRSWYGLKPQSVRQLNHLIKNQQGHQSDQSTLRDEQLFQVARILVKNNRFQLR
jgi:hypothetical protein